MEVSCLYQIYCLQDSFSLVLIPLARGEQDASLHGLMIVTEDTFFVKVGQSQYQKQARPTLRDTNLRHQQPASYDQEAELPELACSA